MDRKERFREGLYFGTAMTIFFIAQDLWTAEQNTTRGVLSSVLSGLIGGVIAGVLFGGLMGRIINSKYVANAAKIELDKDETIIFQTGANHFKGVEGVGGKLYLTNRRLVFQSHKLNIQRHQLSIDLQRLNGVRRYKSAGVLNNGISVTTDTTTEKFVVQKPEQWTTQLEGVITPTNSATATGV